MVGSGELHLNGIGTGFSATRKPRRLERSASNVLSQKSWGFTSAPPVPVITATTGGTKGMQAGKYSFMIAYWNSVTEGYSNPTAVIKLDGTSAALTITASGRFEFNFTNSKIGMPDNADGFTIYGSQSGGGVTAVNESSYNQGAWLYWKDVKLTDLDINNKIFVEMLDAEMGAVVSGDNNEPPDCEMIAEFANVPFFISSLGKRLTTNPLGTSPGNYVVPTKVSNREAAPKKWRVGVGDEITGFALGVGRLFTLTPTGLPFVTPTGRTELSRLVPTQLDIPFTQRPFWTKGGISPYNIVVVQGDVFSISGSMPLRSPSNADDSNVVPFELGGAMEDLFRDLPDGYYLVQPDPKNQQVCYIASAVEKNDAGYWVSRIYPYSLQTNNWMPAILVSSDTQDMIISGATVVNQRLEFLAGGRVAGGTYSVGTYRYDEPSGEPIAYYFVFQPSDSGEELKSKIMKTVRITGRITDAKVQIHGATWGEEISIEDMIAGINSISGDIVFTDSTGIQRQMKKKHLVKNLQLWALRFSGVWDGTGKVNRIDEIVLEGSIHGVAQ